MILFKNNADDETSKVIQRITTKASGPYKLIPHINYGQVSFNLIWRLEQFDKTSVIKLSNVDRGLIKRAEWVWTGYRTRDRTQLRMLIHVKRRLSIKPTKGAELSSRSAAARSHDLVNFSFKLHLNFACYATTF